MGVSSEWVGRACMAAKVPHILAGGYRTHLGFLGPTVIPYESACWKCFALDYEENDPFARMGWKPLEMSLPSGGGLGPLNAMVSAFHAWEAIRVLSGILPPLMVNRKGEIDFITMATSWHEVPRNPRCLECSAGATPAK